MTLNGKKIIGCDFGSDVKNLTVGRASPVSRSIRVLLGVNDEAADESLPLIVAQLVPSHAVKLARALLDAAGFAGTPCAGGHGTRYTFVD